MSKYRVMCSHHPKFQNVSIKITLPITNNYHLPITLQIFIVFLVCSRHDSKFWAKEMNRIGKSPAVMVPIAGGDRQVN